MAALCRRAEAPYETGARAEHRVEGGWESDFDSWESLARWLDPTPWGGGGGPGREAAMKRATLERLAVVFVLAACICAECIPLLLALVAAAALCGGHKFPSDCEFVKKKKTAGAATPGGQRWKEVTINQLLL